MSALTALSRITGFVRILVVAAVLGTTYLGNTYQSANSVPNLLFELFAAGALQAVLVPTLVHLLDRHLRGEAEHVAGSVLGLWRAVNPLRRRSESATALRSSAPRAPSPGPWCTRT